MTNQETGKPQGADNKLLLGVTGSIASGKSTVALMFEELGAPIIDYDLITRAVVEPGRPALADIVDYFGEDILTSEGTLDRQKMREIVFQDQEKLRKLESITYPWLPIEYKSQVDALAAKNPNAIIQVVVPLMIERGMQSIYDKVLVVYVPEEEQIKRLMKRDNSSREMALNIINSQMNLEEKKGYADYVIDNSGSLENSREQVNDIWKKLKEFQKNRI